MRFSASRLKTWMACPLQAHFQYDMRLPRETNAKQTFGTIVHHCLELYNQTGNIELALRTFKEAWHNPAKLQLEHGRWPKFSSYGSLRERGVQILTWVHENTKWDSRTVIGTEHRFCVPFGKHELTGVVDLIEYRTSGKGKKLLRIVDYKTGTKAPWISELALDIQFTIYIYASLQPEFWLGNLEAGPDFVGLTNGEFLMQTYEGVPRRGIWFHLWGPKEIDAGDRDDADFMRLYRLLEQVERATEAQVFVPRIGEACGLCDFKAECGIEIPSKDEIAAQENAWI